MARNIQRRYEWGGQGAAMTKNGQKKAAIVSFLLWSMAAAQTLLLWPVRAGGAGERGVTIQRAASPDSAHASLVEAHRTFMQGNIEIAEQGYAQILVDDPGNRDALLGQAAIAIFREQPAMAAATYQRLLEQNPGDALALAGLLSLSGDLPRHEGRLRTLLSRHPGADLLPFVLGNLCAVQWRWPEARHFFLSALRMDPANPDYAFNLAVSLEHLRESREAAEYYQMALDLGEHRPAIFARKTARNRLADLAGEIKP